MPFAEWEVGHGGRSQDMEVEIREGAISSRADSTSPLANVSSTHPVAGRRVSTLAFSKDRAFALKLLRRQIKTPTKRITPLERALLSIPRAQNEIKPSKADRSQKLSKNCASFRLGIFVVSPRTLLDSRCGLRFPVDGEHS